MNHRLSANHRHAAPLAAVAAKNAARKALEAAARDFVKANLSTRPATRP